MIKYIQKKDVTNKTSKLFFLIFFYTSANEKSSVKTVLFYIQAFEFQLLKNIKFVDCHRLYIIITYCIFVVVVVEKNNF